MSTSNVTTAPVHQHRFVPFRNLSARCCYDCNMSYETYANERILALQAEVDSWRAAQEECHELHTSAAHGTQSIVEYLGVLRQRIHDINNEESDIELSSGDADILLACVQIAGEFGAIIADGIRKMSQDAV